MNYNAKGSRTTGNTINNKTQDTTRMEKRKGKKNDNNNNMKRPFYLVDLYNTIFCSKIPSTLSPFFTDFLFLH